MHTGVGTPNFFAVHSEIDFANAELDALLPSADIVAILLPLTPETHSLIDERFLNKLKDGAILVNAGRWVLHVMLACW